MTFFQRYLRSWPYAANSTGRYRGSLSLGLTVGRVQVYEAVGAARATFMDRLGPEVVEYLNDNGASLQESGSFVDLSLFMMGKSPLRTKPMLMFVSDDKGARLEAFNMIKQSAIMDSYPGFGLGNMDLRAEFENLQALGGTKPGASAGLPSAGPPSSTSTSARLKNEEKPPITLPVAYVDFLKPICAPGSLFQSRDELTDYRVYRFDQTSARESYDYAEDRPEYRPTWNSTLGLPEVPRQVYTIAGGQLESQRLLYDDHSGSAPETRSAIGGGLVSHQGKHMVFTVNHFLEKRDSAQTRPMPSTFETDGATECDVTGLSDFEDDDEELADITSRGSMTPESTTSRGTPPPTDDGETASVFSSGSIADQTEFVASVSRGLESLPLDDPQPLSLPLDRVQLGHVTVSSNTLDFALIEIDSTYEAGLRMESQHGTSQLLRFLDDDLDRSFACLYTGSSSTPRRHPLAGLGDHGLHLLGTTDTSKAELMSSAIPLESFREHIEEAPRDAAIRTTTPDGGIIGGTLSGSPSFVRLPRCKDFQEVYVGKLNQPLAPGDCGSWIRDAVSGRLYGHVIAGSPTTGLIMIIPARHSFAAALASMAAALHSPKVQEVSHPDHQYHAKEQATYHCSHCQNSFVRQCDLTKHDKSHGWPYKCSEPNCEKASVGWRTAHELQRHVNDKHSPNSKSYHCSYRNCLYQSQRESNCRQHMEWVHGLPYPQDDLRDSLRNRARIGNGQATATHDSESAKGPTAVALEIETPSDPPVLIKPPANAQDVVRTREWTSIIGSGKAATPTPSLWLPLIAPRINSAGAMHNLPGTGLDVVRINSSHGNYQYHQSVIDPVRTDERAKTSSTASACGSSGLLNEELFDTVYPWQETSFETESNLHSGIENVHPRLRPFRCVFYFAGCSSTFTSKNEWKRHVTEQHIQADQMAMERRTDNICGKDATPWAGFNRKDIFTKHLRLLGTSRAFQGRRTPRKVSSDVSTLPGRSAAEMTVSDDTKVEQRYMSLGHRDNIPELRECNFAEFKNRFDPDVRAGPHVADVLVSGLLLDQEIQQELKLRHKLLDNCSLTPSSQIVKNKAPPGRTELPSQPAVGKPLDTYAEATICSFSILGETSTPKWQAHVLLDGYGDDCIPPDLQQKCYKCEHVGCTKPFNRAADLDRHQKGVHSADKQVSWIYDYRPCPRQRNPFHRKDHFRDHLREFPKEDISTRHMGSRHASANDQHAKGRQNTVDDDHGEGIEVIQANEQCLQSRMDSQLTQLLSLRDRDAIFIVDKGSSMSNNWQLAHQLLEHMLSRIHGDDSGIDIHFNGGDSKERHKKEALIGELGIAVETLGHGSQVTASNLVGKPTAEYLRHIATRLCQIDIRSAQTITEDIKAESRLVDIVPRSTTEDLSDPGRHPLDLSSQTPDPGLWNCDMDEFRKWCDAADHSTPWLKAVPGAGKSGIASSMAHELREVRRDPPPDEEVSSAELLVHTKRQHNLQSLNIGDMSAWLAGVDPEYTRLASPDHQQGTWRRTDQAKSSQSSDASYEIVASLATERGQELEILAAGALFDEQASSPLMYTLHLDM